MTSQGPDDPPGGVAPATPPRSSSSGAIDPLIGQTLLERYEVLRRIGSGGMGAVYVGRQKTVGREVALKVLRSDLTTNEQVRERFRREAEIIGKLRHPNTIQLIDYGETADGLAVMVMELLVGQPLNDRLRDKGPLPLLDALNVGIDIASSLGEAHQAGMVHRDLKPANIFLVEVAGQTHAKVLDFGIARILDEEATRITSTGQVFGTPRYMSPEQALSTGEVDARSDLYSLGLILYECIVGQPPFVAQTSIQYLTAHSTKAAPRLRDHDPNAPEPLDQLIDACLAKSVDARPLSADAVLAALVAIRRMIESNGATHPFDLKLPSSSKSSGMNAGGATWADGSTPGQPAGDTALGRGSGGVEKTSGAARRSETLLRVGLGLAFAGLLGVGSLWLKHADSNEIVLLFDAGEAEVSFDAGSGALVAALDESDAGDGDSIEDAGAREARPDASALFADAEGRAEPESRDASENRHPGKTHKPRDTRVASQPGQNVVTGPAAMTLPTDDDGQSLLELARNCKESVLSGNARLKLGHCPGDCAIIVDEKCGGRTPASDIALSRGFHSVSVVCGTRVVLTAEKRFPDDEPVSLSCR